MQAQMGHVSHVTKLAACHPAMNRHFRIQTVVAITTDKGSPMRLSVE